MSKEAVEAVIGKAMVESDFRDALFANPDQALAAYDLTDEEAVMLKSIDAESMGEMAGALDERISKGKVGLPTNPTDPGKLPLPKK